MPIPNWFKNWYQTFFTGITAGALGSTVVVLFLDHTDPSIQQNKILAFFILFLILAVLNLVLFFISEKVYERKQKSFIQSTSISKTFN